MKTNLVQVITEDDLILSGLYNEADTSKPAIIHIHGFCSDFYTRTFIHSISSAFQNINYATLTVQTRGTWTVTEFFKSNRIDSVTIGSYYEIMSEAHLDISAWIKFLIDKGYMQFILVGHSQGTFKSIRYLFEGKYKNQISKLVLLSPLDIKGFLENKAPGKMKEYVEIAKQKIRDGHALDFVLPEYEDFLFSYQTYVSLYEDTDLSNIFDFYRFNNYDFPILNQINIPVQIQIGTLDEFFYYKKFNTFEDALNVLRKNIKNLDLKVIKNCRHSYVGFEDIVTKNALEFVLRKG